MKKQVEMAFVVCLLVAIPTFGSWVETFDSGVGRFTQTYGLGDEKFTWNETGQNLHFEFRRRLHWDAYADMRYADEGRLLDLEVDDFSFGLTFTLEGWSKTHYGNVGLIGFLCGSPETPETSLATYLSYSDGMGVSFGGARLDTGILYSFECNYRAQTRTFYVALYDLRNGQKIGTMTRQIDVANQPPIYGFGFCADNGSGAEYYWIRGYIDTVWVIPVYNANISVKTPNGGESCTVGTTQDITWSAEGVGDQLLLQYSSDNGSSWIDIATVSDTGTYPWLIPDVFSNTCLVKISNVDDPSIFDISDAPFVIVGYEWFVNPANGHRYALTLNHGTWLACEAEAVAQGGHLVTINDPDERDWLLDPSRPLCASYMACCPGSAGGNGSWIGLYYDGIGDIHSVSSWKWLTGEVGSDFLVPAPSFFSYEGVHMTMQGIYNGPGQISNAPGHDSIPDAYLKGIIEVASSDVFLYVRSPYGGAILPATGTTEIKWDSPEGINQILLEYSTNNGTDWTNIATVSNTGSYQWQVPDIASDQCLIRISDAQNPSTFDVSNSTFSIHKHDWYFYNGHQYALTLKHSNWVNAEEEAVSIGGHLATINDPAERDWLLDPSLPWGNGEWIGMYYDGTGDIHSLSSWKWLTGEIGSDFLVPAPSFYSYHGIHMTMQGRNNNPGQISNAPGHDSIPDAYLYGIIEYVPTINILTPKPGDFVSSINPFTISWEMETKIAVPQVKIELSTDHGTTWETIGQVDNTGSYPWLIPDIISNQCLIRISDPMDPAFKATTGLFEIGRSPRVYFADANLKAAVEAALGVTNPTAEDMLKLTYLNAKSKGITSLIGLETALNITTLYLHQNAISDIAPLVGLNKLTVLNLYLNKVTDLSSLAGLTKLYSLSLSSNTISDISSLANLVNLTTLYLSSNPIQDFSALTGHTQFKEIYAIRTAVLSKETYLAQIPAIRANNPRLAVFQYDPGCKSMMGADVNQDCRVNLSDLAMMAADWLKCNHIYEEMCL